MPCSNKEGVLDRTEMHAQVDACVANGAHGLAVPGLATEVAKLTGRERYLLVEWVAQALSAIVFVMQSIDHLVCYGKRIAAHCLSFAQVYDRAPGIVPSAFGLECVHRYAAQLGPFR